MLDLRDGTNRAGLTLVSAEVGRPERRLRMRIARVSGPARTHAVFCVREHDSVEVG